jgi:hypothetical protein
MQVFCAGYGDLSRESEERVHERGGKDAFENVVQQQFEREGQAAA